MTSTFLETTQKNLKNYISCVTPIMQFEQSSVDILPTPVHQTMMTFIENAHPASVFEPLNVFIIYMDETAIKKAASRDALEKRSNWRDVEYRQAYMESSVEQGIAWQIRINREMRKLSQSDLAKRIGSKQSAISRAEDTTYGRHRIETLVKIANAFDCALQIKFVSYSKLAIDNSNQTPGRLYAKSYEEEMSQ